MTGFGRPPPAAHAESWDIPAGRRRDWERPVTLTPAIRGSA